MKCARALQLVALSGWGTKGAVCRLLLYDSLEQWFVCHMSSVILHTVAGDVKTWYPLLDRVQNDHWVMTCVARTLKYWLLSYWKLCNVILFYRHETLYLWNRKHGNVNLCKRLIKWLRHEWLPWSNLVCEPRFVTAPRLAVARSHSVMIIPGRSSQLQEVPLLYRHFQNTMKLVTVVRQIPSEGFFFFFMEFTSLQCITSGTTDTAGNLACHVQELDTEEGMMNKT